MRPVNKGRPTNYNVDINTRTIDFTNIAQDNASAIISLKRTLTPFIVDVIDILDDIASEKTKILNDIKYSEVNRLRIEIKQDKRYLDNLKRAKSIEKKEQEIETKEKNLQKLQKEWKEYKRRLSSLNKVKKTSETKLTEIYREAFDDLTSILGRYCSFCELSERSSALAVEHVVPKAPYPTKFVDWNNFLLGCPNCNSVKASKPPRADAKRWAGGMAPTADQIAQAALDHYYWPHISQYSFRFYIYTLQYKQGNSFVSFPMPNAADYRNFRNVNARNKTVTAEMNHNGMWTNTEFVVLPIALDPSLAFNFDKSKIENTIDLVKLNRIINDDQEKDIRTFNRTEAWFKVLRQLRILDEDVTRAGADDQRKKDNFNSSWGRLLDCAVSEGFYSIWITILKEILYPNYLDNPNGHNNLGQKFVYDTGNAQTDQYRKFPGTNATALP